MKMIALTVAVLALGVTACQDNAADNSASATNTVEAEAAADTNAAAAAADEALNAAGNAVEDAGNAVENAGNAVENAAE